MDVVILLEPDLLLGSTAPTAHPPTNKSLIEPRSDSHQQGISTDATCHEDIGPLTVQKMISCLKSTQHFPLTPELSHHHSSIDSRRSISLVQSAESGSGANNLTPASDPLLCAHCGFPRIRSAFHPNEHTCHTSLVAQKHELTSHMGPESLGQSSRLLFDDDRSFD